MHSTRLFTLACIVLPFCVIAVGCKAGKEPRKTLPDAGLAIAGNSFSALPFYAVDTLVAGKKFTAIYLKDPGFDSLALQLVHSYEPFSGSLLKMIAGQKLQGIMVDFRERSDVPAAFANLSIADAANQVQGQENSSLDIVFLWDELSYDRASTFMNEVRNSPFLSVVETGGKSLEETGYPQDCFTSTSPGFKDQ